MRDWTEWVRSNLSLDDYEGPAARGVVEELATQLEDVYRAARARGLTEADADAEARSHIGDWEALAASIRGARRSGREGAAKRAAERADERLRRRGRLARWLADLVLDTRLAARSLGKTPIFTVAVVLLLGLGVGANAAVFSVLKAVFLEPLPYPEPNEVVILWETTVERRGRGPASFPNYQDWRRDNQTFEAMGVGHNMQVSLSDGDVPVQIQGARATASLFDVLGVEPLLGRTILPEEDASDSRVVVLSHEFWTDHFDRDPSVLGRAIRLSGEAYVVVGVMPDDFVMTSPWNANDLTQLWVPFPTEILEQGRGSRSYPVYARLRDGVSVDAARADMERVAVSLAEAYPATNRTQRVMVMPLHLVLFGGAAGGLILVLGAALMVLLIACGNIAGLLLARGAVRRREVALRAALGAGRGRIIRELLTESGLLALGGGAVAMVLVVWGTGALRGFLPATLPRIDQIAVDGPVLGLALALSLLTALVFGLSPALHAARVDHVEALKEGTAATGRRRSRARRGFVIAQLALTLTLVHGTVLLVGSYLMLRQWDHGFDPENTVTARIVLTGPRYEDADVRTAFFRDLIPMLEAIPGVEAAAAVNRVPFEGGTNTRIAVEGRELPPDPNDRPLVERKVAVGDYLRVMGIPLRKGRKLDPSDAEGIRGVVINERMAESVWPNEDPIGKRFAFNYRDEIEWLTVVGVAADVGQFIPGRVALSEAYRAYPLYPRQTMYLAVKTAGPPASVVPDLRRAVQTLDPQLPLTQIRTGEQLMEDHTGQREFMTTLIGLFAVLALVLAMAGIYGMMAYYVAQHTRELGVRMALGADRGGLLRHVLWKGLALAGIGVVVGAGGAVSATVVTRNLLFGIEPTNPWSMTGVVGLMLAVATLATLVPAFRATRVNPARTLQAE